ncbi:MAG: MarR family transcriptional regulator [Acidimicrobiales bacterium]|nr:MarR family transcriptional regulator [Acidimicrobiales bacterium]
MPSAAEFDRLAASMLTEHDGSATLANALMINLFRTAMRCEADFEAAVQRPLGLSFAGFRLLHILLVAGSLPSGELARLALTTPATVSSVLNTLEKRDLVRRNRSKEDRRRVDVELTDAGRRLIDESLTRQIARERRWVAGIPDEDLRTALRVLRAMGGDMRGPRRPPQADDPDDKMTPTTADPTGSHR